MDITLYSFVITMISAVACMGLCFMKNKTNKTKTAAIVSGIMLYFATCFFFGLVT